MRTIAIRALALTCAGILASHCAISGHGGTPGGIETCTHSEETLAQDYPAAAITEALGCHLALSNALLRWRVQFTESEAADGVPRTSTYAYAAFLLEDMLRAGAVMHTVLVRRAALVPFEDRGDEKISALTTVLDHQRDTLADVYDSLQDMAWFILDDLKEAAPQDDRDCTRCIKSLLDIASSPDINHWDPCVTRYAAQTLYQSFPPRLLNAYHEQIALAAEQRKHYELIILYGALPSADKTTLARLAHYMNDGYWKAAVLAKCGNHADVAAFIDMVRRLDYTANVASLAEALAYPGTEDVRAFIEQGVLSTDVLLLPRGGRCYKRDLFVHALHAMHRWDAHYSLREDLARIFAAGSAQERLPGLGFQLCLDGAIIVTNMGTAFSALQYFTPTVSNELYAGPLPTNTWEFQLFLLECDRNRLHPPHQ